MQRLVAGGTWRSPVRPVSHRSRGPSDPKRCESTKRNGGPCQAQALPDSPHCWAHVPGRAEQRAEARRKGGHHSAKVMRLHWLAPPRLLPIFDQLEQALGEVHAGELDPKQAQAMAALARALATLLTAGELEERVRRLEAGALSEQRGATSWRD